jgi:hypothetical protein
MRDKLVYISGKYTAINKDGTFNDRQIHMNILKAREYAIDIWEKGYTAICPHLNTYHFERDATLEWEDYIAGDLELLKRSDIIFMLPNWEQSKGAILEKEFAEKNKIKVVTNLDEL